jgi:hypothetical protein
MAGDEVACVVALVADDGELSLSISVTAQHSEPGLAFGAAPANVARTLGV